MNTSYSVNATPSVRRFARELGVDLELLANANPGQLISRQDVIQTQSGNAPLTASTDHGIPVIQQPDWSAFGDTQRLAVSRIQKASAKHLHSAWLNAPQVTHFDVADITELEAYRQRIKDGFKAQGVSITPLVFMLKAVALALKAYPRFNSALSEDQETLIQRNYYHIGVAVETPNGLLVPVIRDVDRKSLFRLAAELSEISAKARTGKLKITDMQGGCFSVSSLGSIGGTQFTPIVNSPEVGILGLAQARKSVVPDENDQLTIRLQQPLAVSYDHRVVDGACAARFTAYLATVLTDVRQLMLHDSEGSA